MCGIAGAVNLDSSSPLSRELAERMAGTLTHRGPDDADTYCDPLGRCALGFRRLSIIDLAGGRQPISNENGKLWLVFNGEIYNFQELRSDLIARGHQFKTSSDSEAIVHLYEELGPAAMERLDGMFALAIWDEKDGRLLLARDRLGKKPLVIAEHGGVLYFASEIKALLAAGIPRRVDVQALHEYLLFQYVPPPRSIWRNVRKPPPATWWSIPAGRPLNTSPQRYWSPTIGLQRAAPPAYSDALRQLDNLLTRAVRRRLVADVPLGAFLSGGVDSSTVVYLMHRLGATPLLTFSVGFDDPRFDETSYARAMAASVGAIHFERVVRPDAETALEDLSHIYDEPFADSSAIPTIAVSRHARQHVTVALTGDGGDECFMGYDRYAALELTRWLAVAPAVLRRAVAGASGVLPRGRAKTLGLRLRRLLSVAALSDAQRYQRWVSVFSPEQLTDAYQPPVATQLDQTAPLAWFEGLLDLAPRHDATAASLADILSYLPNDLLVKVDLASMACGLECRAPLLDRQLVEFALSLPKNWKLSSAGGKRILKDWARGKLPQQVIDRPKMGFGVPIGEWLRGPLRGLLEERVLRSDSFCRRFLREAWLQEQVQSHLSGREERSHGLWALLMLELWADRWQPSA